MSATQKRREYLRSIGACVNGENHGPSVKGGRCAPCWRKHKGVSADAPRAEWKRRHCREELLEALRGGAWFPFGDLMRALEVTDVSGSRAWNTYGVALGRLVTPGLVERRGRSSAYEYRLTSAGSAWLEQRDQDEGGDEEEAETTTREIRTATIIPVRASFEIRYVGAPAKGAAIRRAA